MRSLFAPSSLEPGNDEQLGGALPLVGLAAGAELAVEDLAAGALERRRHDQSVGMMPSGRP
jgi:hypothetical protein